MNIHVAPIPPLSLDPPIAIVSESSDTATDDPCLELPIFPVPINISCCDHTSSVLIKTHVAPIPPLLSGPEETMVDPSRDIEIENPCLASPIAPVPTSFDC